MSVSGIAAPAHATVIRIDPETFGTVGSAASGGGPRVAPTIDASAQPRCPQVPLREDAVCPRPHQRDETLNRRTACMMKSPRMLSAPNRDAWQMTVMSAIGSLLPVGFMLHGFASVRMLLDPSVTIPKTNRYVTSALCAVSAFSSLLGWNLIVDAHLMAAAGLAALACAAGCGAGAAQAYHWNGVADPAASYARLRHVIRTVRD